MGRGFHTIGVATASPGGRVAQRTKMRKKMRKEEKIRNTDRNLRKVERPCFIENAIKTQ